MDRLSTAKRKRVAEAKFYAVRVGHRPGIYQTWAECLEQIKGFKGATFKSFPSLTHAEQFLAGEDPLSRPSTASNRFYAVKSGRVPGIYTDWPSAQQQILGWTKPRHKCFPTRAEAQRFLEESETKADTGAEAESIDGLAPEANDMWAKKRKTAMAANGSGRKPTVEGYDPENYDAGTGPLPLGTTDGFDPNVILDPATGQVIYKTSAQKRATKLQAVGPTTESMLRIYCDGSALGNGRKGAFAGVGVYFGPTDSRNISEPLPGPRQTNQRAELTAIVRALDTVPKDRDVTIVTDSQYSINCVTKWHGYWRKNAWKTATGKSVENRDIIENIVNKVEERESWQSRTAFEWVKAHADDTGNEGADRLAVNGARKAAHLPLL